MTRYEAFTSINWRDSGIAQIIVARIRDGGRAEIGFFLLDTWCLGVKDAFLNDDGSEYEFRELLRERLPEEFRERLHPACAKKLIDGAIAFAETFGFAPARDYRKAKRVLTGLNSADCPETFTYGRDGKPFYCEGPNDTPERTERVLALLKKRLGPDGYGYERSEDGDSDENDPDAVVLDARDALQIFFDDLEDDGPNFHEFAGMVAAAHICPHPISPTALIKIIGGPARYIRKNDTDLADFTKDLGVYWNHIAQLYAIYAGPAGDDANIRPIDVFAEDFPDADDAAQLARMTGAIIGWCKGFTRATHEWPEAWGDALTRADLKPHFDLIRAWSDPEGAPENIGIISGANEPDPLDDSQKQRRLPRAIIALLRSLRPDFGK